MMLFITVILAFTLSVSGNVLNNASALTKVPNSSRATQEINEQVKEALVRQTEEGSPQQEDLTEPNKNSQTETEEQSNRAHREKAIDDKRKQASNKAQEFTPEVGSLVQMEPVPVPADTEPDHEIFGPPINVEEESKVMTID